MIISTSIRFLICLSIVLVSSTAIADDWSQWLGNQRDGHWRESGILTEFPDGGAKVLWRAKIDGGYAGPAVADNRVFVMDYVRSQGDPTPNPGKRNPLKGTERVNCLDAKTGEVLWQHEYSCDYNISYPGGPRATPTVDGDLVFTLGAEGHLCCLNVENGDVIWEKDLKKEYGVKESPIWGYAAHPLVVDDKLFCMVGGEGSVAVAFNKKSGKEIWRALSASDAGYCPPTMINAGGADQLLIWHPQAINSLNPESGEVYWSVSIEPNYGMSIIAPIQHGDYLLLSGLQGASLLLELDSNQPAAKEVWRGKSVHPDHNPPLVVDNHIYGIDGKGHMRCIELVSGERVWESLEATPNGRPAGSATGFIVKNEDHYYIFNEGGELITARMTPDGYEGVDRMKVLEPTSRTGNRSVVWSHPAFANKCMFARNDKEIVCISLAK